MNRLFALFLFLGIGFLSGCETAYYNTMEKVGVHKRDILIDRIESTQEAQKEAQEEFVSALEHLRSINDFDGGDLEKFYNKLNDRFEDSEAAAKEIVERIEKVDSVADALFSEWKDEIELYTSSKLKRESQSKLNATKKRFRSLMSSLDRSRQAMTPVLNSLRDNTLYLKHNLNARAITSLKGELKSIDADITKLIKNMESSIKESDMFIDGLRGDYS